MVGSGLLRTTCRLQWGTHTSWEGEVAMHVLKTLQARVCYNCFMFLLERTRDTVESCTHRVFKFETSIESLKELQQHMPTVLYLRSLQIAPSEAS